MTRLSQLTRLMIFVSGLITLCIVVFVQPSSVHSQDAPTATPVAFVEAMQLAKVRAGPAVTYSQIGTIVTGQTYKIMGRSSHFPWYLISLPNTMGWVYKDIVKVTGNLDGVPWTEMIITTIPDAIISPSEPTLTAVANIAANVSTDPLSPPTTVMIEAIDMTIVRYGPGTDFPRVGKITRGHAYAMVRRHARFLWYEIAFDGVASGRGWVYQGTVHVVSGDINQVPQTHDTKFSYPTLTPTPQKVVAAVPPGTVTPIAFENQVMAQLSDNIYKYLLAQKFEPGTERQGSVFLMNLTTGHMFSVNPDVVYSAASLMKIPLMVAYYRKVDRPPTQDEAWHMANMMVCSSNDSSDSVLGLLGEGDMQRGMAYVNQTVHMMGLSHTTLSTTFTIDQAAPAVLSDSPLSADANPQNQTTPADLGWLMNGIYQCAIDGKGPLTSAYPEITAMECREMLNMMSFDKSNVMIDAGVPDDLLVAHKRGWVNDTHGDAAVVITPGGDYILTVILHARGYLGPDISYPTIAEISRATYNVFNPSRALDTIHTGSIPSGCQPDAGLVEKIKTSDAPALH
jgi:uncharacterized protein YraI/beta-lactamase class A